ncbi:MAG: hypothetical protein ACYCVW_16545 [Rhodocyclaceae bacterium]
MNNEGWLIIVAAVGSSILSGAVTWGMMRVEIRFLLEGHKDHEARLRSLEKPRSHALMD